MRNLLLAVAAATSVWTGPIAVSQAQVAPSPQLIFGVDNAADMPSLDRVQFFWGGRNFCWYEDAWRGPGWYWCGYAWHRGYGWGGPFGWHNWRGGHGWRGGARGRGGYSGARAGAFAGSARSAGLHAGGGRGGSAHSGGGGHAGGGGHGGGRGGGRHGGH
jgi:hypothetical protein